MRKYTHKQIKFAINKTLNLASFTDIPVKIYEDFVDVFYKELKEVSDKEDDKTGGKQ